MVNINTDNWYRINKLIKPIISVALMEGSDQYRPLYFHLTNAIGCKHGVLYNSSISQNQQSPSLHKFLVITSTV